MNGRVTSRQRFDAEVRMTLDELDGMVRNLRLSLLGVEVSDASAKRRVLTRIRSAKNHLATARRVLDAASTDPS